MDEHVLQRGHDALDPGLDAGPAQRRRQPASGGLRLVDRAKDLIIVSGFNVYPVEVEDVLRSHPDVRDAAVVCEPSPRTGEAVVAYVQPAPGRSLDPEALASHSAKGLARYKCPTRYEIVDELPRAVSGKLLRRELRD